MRRFHGIMLFSQFRFLKLNVHQKHQYALELKVAKLEGQLLLYASFDRRERAIWQRGF